MTQKIISKQPKISSCIIIDTKDDLHYLHYKYGQQRNSFFFVIIGLMPWDDVRDTPWHGDHTCDTEDWGDLEGEVHVTSVYSGYWLKVLTFVGTLFIMPPLRGPKGQRGGWISMFWGSY